MSFERGYLRLIEDILLNGIPAPSRAGPTRSVFGRQLRIPDLADGFFPLLTTRKIHYRPVLGELAAFLRGATKLSTFKEFGCNYWDANASTWPVNFNKHPAAWEVGRIYGSQWRAWRGWKDQLAELVEGLKTDPHSRRHVVTAWAPDALDKMCLPPCHILFQCYVRDHRLSMLVYMRSVDVCLGLPSDIALYAALLLILCNETDYRPGDLVFMLGDAHIYQNHESAAEVQLEQMIKALPTYELNPTATIDTFLPSDLSILNYNPGRPINYELNV